MPERGERPGPRPEVLKITLEEHADSGELEGGSGVVDSVSSAAEDHEPTLDESREQAMEELEDLARDSE